MYKILLVEDDVDIRQIIIKYFHKRDMEVIELWMDILVYQK